MQGYFIKSTKITPSVYFNPRKRILDLRGKSSPENPLTFYNHILSSLDQYHLQDYPTITTNFAFVYFNTSTSKCLYMILKKLDLLTQSGKKVTVNWYYEDEDMQETGEDFGSFFNLNFNMISIPEINVLGLGKSKAAENVAA